MKHIDDGDNLYRCYDCVMKIIDDDDYLIDGQKANIYQKSILVEKHYYDTLAHFLCHLNTHYPVINSDSNEKGCCPLCLKKGSEKEILEHISRWHKNAGANNMERMMKNL